MAENLPITLLGESDRAEDSCVDSPAIIGLQLDILGEPIHFRISAAQRQARLADIVPAARTLSTKLALAVLEKLRKQQKFVPCRKGCSACCNYLIPLSVPEVFRMREELLAMPANQSKALLKSCLDASRKILDDRPKSYGTHIPKTTNGTTQVSQLSSWYAGLQLPCPFLSGRLCTIYQKRPTACREHIVTGSALLCETEGPDKSQVVPMPVSVLEALAQLAGDLEGTSMEAVMLPLALPWAEENLARHHWTWPTVMMVQRFVEIIKEMASKNSAATVASA